MNPYFFDTKKIIMMFIYNGMYKRDSTIEKQSPLKRFTI